MASHLDRAKKMGKLPKRLMLAQEMRPKVMQISGVDQSGNFASGVEEVTEGGSVASKVGAQALPFRATSKTPGELLTSVHTALGEASFTGKGDQATVLALLNEFSTIVDEGISKWAQSVQDDVGNETKGSTDNELGAAVFEMAGACWLLPQFVDKQVRLRDSCELWVQPCCPCAHHSFARPGARASLTCIVAHMHRRSHASLTCTLHAPTVTRRRMTTSSRRSRST